jgi:hypothetical protein
MSQIVVDAALREKLRSNGDVVAICDEKGELLGVFHQAPLPGGCPSPHSREDIQRFREEKGGRPLAEILKELEASQCGP